MAFDPLARAKDADATHRLTDMLVKEVSLVDFAANQRKFLITKRDNMALGNPLAANADGTLSSGGSAGASTNAAPATKAGAALTQDAKSAIASVLTAGIRGMQDALARTEGATVVNTEEEMDVGEIADAALSSAEMVQDAMLATMGMDDESADTVMAADPEQTEGGEEPDLEDEDEDKEPPPPMAKAAVLPVGKRIRAALAKREIAMVKNERSFETLVVKAGAKMSAKRLMQLKTAWRVIDSVIKDVSTPKARKEAVKQPKVSAKTKAAVTEKSAHDATAQQLAALEKRLAESNAELVKMRSQSADLGATPPRSNASAVQGQANTPPAFTWPQSFTKKLVKTPYLVLTNRPMFGHAPSSRPKGP